MQPLKLDPVQLELPSTQLETVLKERAFLRQVERIALDLGNRAGKPCPTCGEMPWDHQRDGHLYFDKKFKLYHSRLQDLVEKDAELVLVMDRALRQMFSSEEGTEAPGPGAAAPGASAQSGQ